MDIRKILEEYEEGRIEVKEYPFFGISTELSMSRKRRKARGVFLRSVRREHQIRHRLKRRIFKKNFKTGLSRQSCKQHLHSPVLSTDEKAAVDKAVTYIEDGGQEVQIKKDPKSMNVMIDHQPGHTICFVMQDNCTVKNVKLKIEGKTGTPYRLQRLRHQGRPVKDSQTLSDIDSGETDLRLLLFEGHLRGGAPPTDKEADGAQGGEKEEIDFQAELERFSKLFNKPVEELKEFVKQGSAPVNFRNPKEQPGMNEPTREKLQPTEAVSEVQESGLANCTNLEFLQECFPCISFSNEVLNGESRRFYLKHIFSKKGPKANDLENKFKFLILYDTEKVTLDDDLRTRIWCEVIQKYTKQWTDILPPDQKQGWDTLTDESMVYLNGEPMELRLGNAKTRVQALPIDVIEKSKENAYILLVDDSVVHSNFKGHFSISKQEQDNISFEGKRGKPFHAHITIDRDKVNVVWGDLMREVKSGEELGPLENLKKCKPRRFKTSPVESFKYEENCVIDCVESGDEGSLLTPAHEFKLFTKAVNTDAFLHKFCVEVMRFACACINSRKNGTIHFGIADEDPQKAAIFKVHPSEIVGVPVTDKTQYKDKLTHFINHCFDEENREFARKCICIPEFVKVEPLGASSSTRKYVIEVDVEASYEYTHDKLFSVALPNLSDKKKNKSYQCFIRNGSQSSIITGRNSDSLKKDMERMDAKRKQEELQLGKNFQNMTRQLHNMLVEDCGKLDNTFKRILVLSSIDKSILTPEFIKKASVLGNIPWSFVVDFNSTNKSEPGLCHTLTDDTDFEIHDGEDFNSDRLIKSALSPGWVFGNGISERSPPLSWEKWQLSDRASGLEDLIKKARNEFPQSRTVILFVIQPGFTKIEAFTYGMFLRHFGPNAVSFYIEDEQTEIEWKDFVVNDLKYITEHKLLSRGILGLPLEEFCEEIANLTTHCQKGMIKIPLTENTLCSIERGYFNDKSVQIMDSEDCQYLYEVFQRNQERFNAEKQENENRFYKGQEVSMENLWFTQSGSRHVIERDVMKDLTDCLEYVLSMDPGTSQGVETIRLLYSRGSGGTTVARHFLWGLFHCETPYKARCCIVNCIKPETISTIYNFSKYKNSSRLPTVVLVDDQQDSDFQVLVKGLSEKIENSGSYFKGIPIIFLRVEPSSYPKDEARERDERMCASMDYRLSRKELIRFHEKYVDMQRIHGDGFKKFAEKTLPSFIMMMQRSQKDRETYAERIVTSALPDLNDNEKAMLRYLSLINISVPENKFIYIASFDPIMASIAFRRERYQVNWTKNISLTAEMFLRFKDLPVSDDAYPEQEPGVALMFTEFSEAILSWTYENEQKTIGDIALDFMNCAAFPCSAEVRRVNEFTRCLYYKMYLALQSKKKYTYGTKKEIFSKLITRILQRDRSVSKIDLDKALDVMKLGFEKMERPVLAQQVARLSYIYGSQIEEERETYFEIAEEWVQKALSIRKDSYFLDTAGRIRLHKLKTAFPKQKGSRRHPKLDGLEGCLKALDLCLDSVKWFQDSQRAEQLCQRLNVAGYCGEMQAMIFFLSIISNSIVFQYDPENVRKYLCLPEWIPKKVPWTKEQEKKLKGFRDRFLFCLGKVEQINSIIKIEEEFDTYDFDDPFREFFVFCHPEEKSNELAKWTQNWMSIQMHIGGSMFKNVFNINHTKNRQLRSPENLADLCEIQMKLEENLNLNVEESLKFKDIMFMITVKMASYSPFKKQPLSKESAIEEFLETKSNMETLLQKQERVNGRLKSYCLLFSFMFQWPHSKPEIQTDENWQQSYNDKLRKLQDMSTALQRTYQKPETDHTGEEFCRRQRLEHIPRYASVTTLFYLGKGQGLDMYVHVNELPSHVKVRNHVIDWDHPNITGRLKRLSGRRISCRDIEYTTADNKTLMIEVAGQSRDKYSLEEVTFYLGFSWKGPLAFGVKVKSKSVPYDS